MEIDDIDPTLDVLSAINVLPSVSTTLQSLQVTTEQCSLLDNTPYTTNTTDHNDDNNTTGDSDPSSDPDDDLEIPHKRMRMATKGGKPGTSYARQKQVKMRLQDPTFKPCLLSLEAFRTKILKDDSRAEFKKKDLRAVRCSSCSKWVIMRMLYDTLHWKNHRAGEGCQRNRQKKAYRTSSLFTHGFGQAQAKPKTPLQTTTIPCPGLSRASDPKIDAYLYRSNAAGGGAPSRQVIADQLFGANDDDHINYLDLSPSDKRMVLLREETLYKWKNSRAAQAIYAANCEDLITCVAGQEPTPCSHCCALYRLHSFRVRLNRSIPDEDNMKYVPKVYQDEDLGNIYLRHRGVRNIVELVSFMFLASIFYLTTLVPG